jgi:hypothetical protein
VAVMTLALTGLTKTRVTRINSRRGRVSFFMKCNNKLEGFKKGVKGETGD